MNATQPQHLEALARGNAIRLDGARWRREVAALPAADGRRRLAGALEGAKRPAEVDAMRLAHFLTAARRIGPVLALQIKAHAGIYRTTGRKSNGSSRALKVCDLTLPQRVRLVEELRRLADS